MLWQLWNKQVQIYKRKGQLKLKTLISSLSSKISTEIKDIENERIKKLVKNKIQNIIFEAQSSLNPQHVHYQPHHQIGWSQSPPLPLEGFERHYRYSVSPVHSDCSPPSGASSLTKLWTVFAGYRRSSMSTIFFLNLFIFFTRKKINCYFLP